MLFKLRKIAAVFSAALILVATTVGVGHFHEGVASREGIATAQVSADQGLCPVCQLALHSPGSVAAAAAVARGAAIVEAVFLDAAAQSESQVFSTARVRAPPVSL